MQATSRSEFRRYVAIGDSFTAGAPGLDARWPDELAAALEPAEYHNLGVAGATTREVADAQLGPCVELEPDLVTVVCGVNDVLLTVRPDIDAHAEALERIFSTIRERLPDATIVTVTTPPIAEHIGLRPRSRRRVEQGIRQLNGISRRLSRRYGVLCLEWGDHPLARRRENFAADGFHPSLTGIRRAARACAEALTGHPIPTKEMA
ncbi:MAG TPA: SGNH/GDSL hydrolase family protein [Thermoleophilaceae bacterium]|nr:SGNH/GDSL hydrolase family protein [Thermoleophilaceae bacterium]